MGKTKIEWCDRTWNPITGCSLVSAGCLHCYAERISKRLAGRFGYSKDDPFGVTYHPDRVYEPWKWKKPSLIFVCSMGDLFHPDVPFLLINSIFEVMDPSIKPSTMGRHRFIILTKRDERMARYAEYREKCGLSWPPNVWPGVTVEKEVYIKRIENLLKVKAKVRVVSIEPMLGPVDILWYLATHVCGDCGHRCFHYKRPHDYKGNFVCPSCGSPYCEDEEPLMIHWVIVGAETGPGARWMDPDWSRDVRNQCKEAGTAFFMKQMPNRAKIPIDLMIREYPE